VTRNPVHCQYHCLLIRAMGAVCMLARIHVFDVLLFLFDGLVQRIFSPNGTAILSDLDFGHMIRQYSKRQTIKYLYHSTGSSFPVSIGDTT
jgi:hypothetical protein